MLFLDTETLVRRTTIAVVCILVLAGIGASLWYNRYLHDVFTNGVTETNNLREETSRLGAMTDTVQSIMQTEIIRLRNENERTRTELRTELVKLTEENTRLRAQLRLQDESLQDLKQKLDRELEWRNKNLWFRN